MSKAKFKKDPNNPTGRFIVTNDHPHASMFELDKLIAAKRELIVQGLINVFQL